MHGKKSLSHLYCNLITGLGVWSFVWIRSVIKHLCDIGPHLIYPTIHDCRLLLIACSCALEQSLFQSYYWHFLWNPWCWRLYSNVLLITSCPVPGAERGNWLLVRRQHDWQSTFRGCSVSSIMARPTIWGGTDLTNPTSTSRIPYFDRYDGEVHSETCFFILYGQCVSMFSLLILNYW